MGRSTESGDRVAPHRGHQRFGRHIDALNLIGAPVEARDVALVVAGIHNVRVGGLGAI